MTEHNTAAGERSVEGTWEEIAARASVFRGRRVRLTLLPSEREDSTTPLGEEPTNLAGLLGDYIGGVHGGGESWSESTGDRFADHLANKRQRGQL